MGGRGSGGRNRKPAAVKKTQGNAGHRRLKAKEPPAPSGAPAIPSYLNAQGRDEWNRLVPLLLEMKVLTKADGAALGALCSAYEQLVKATAAIEKYGLICATLDQETGVAVLKVNPGVRIKSDALRHIRSSLASFGLDPASRSRLSISEDPNDRPSDPLENIRRAKTASDVVQ